MKVNDIVLALIIVRLRTQAAIHGATWLTTRDLVSIAKQRRAQHKCKGEW